ncbi:MAG TPA: hypothetical protein VGC07_03230 [Granulicella sp.]
MSDPQQPPFSNVPYTDVPGAPVPPQGGYQQTPPQPGGYPPPAEPSQGLSPNAAAALSYITIIPAIIFLILEPYNRIPLVRFHSIQCLLLAGTSIVLQIGLTICQIALHVIPMSGILFGLLHFAVSIGIIVAWLIALIKASKGEWYKLPVIGDQADRLARS